MINPSANAFLFGDFTIHHKDWLSYSDRTDRPGELCYDLTHMLNFPARNLYCDSDTLSPLDLFLSSDDGICFTMAFPPFGNSDHVVVSVSIDSPSDSHLDALFHCIGYDYSCADWDG